MEGALPRRAQKLTSAIRTKRTVAALAAPRLRILSARTTTLCETHASNSVLAKGPELTWTKSVRRVILSNHTGTHIINSAKIALARLLEQNPSGTLCFTTVWRVVLKNYLPYTIHTHAGPARK